MSFEIYPSITTTSNNWKHQLKEVKKYSLKTVCIFPTFVEKDSHLEIYHSLIKSRVTKIPLVHIRQDMDEKEIDYLMDHFEVAWLNIHSQILSNYILKYDLSKFHNQMLLENTGHPLFDEARTFIGLCVDFSHLENQHLKKSDLYTDWEKCIHTYPIKAAHISAIKNNLSLNPHNILSHDFHKYSQLEEFDYLKRYKEFLPEVCAMELENTIEEQLKAKEYIEKII